MPGSRGVSRVKEKVFNRYTIPSTSSIRDAMCVIDANTEGFVLVRNPSLRVVGCVTDGDIRRGLIRGVGLGAGITSIMNRQFRSVNPSMGREAALEFMVSHSIRNLPVIDKKNRLVSIHFLDHLLGRKIKNNVAIIMCGGEGQRLRPITATLPKPMVRVAGRPILERLVMHLVGYGIRTVYLSVNYRADIITNHFGNGDRFGCQIHYLKEKKPLGTAGSLTLLIPPNREPIIVMNGDLVTQVDVGRLLSFHKAQDSFATVVSRSYTADIPFGVIHTEGNKFISIVEKPLAQCIVNAGIYVLNPSLLRLFPRGEPLGMTELLTELARRNKNVRVFRTNDEWIDVGRRMDLEIARGER